MAKRSEESRMSSRAARKSAPEDRDQPRVDSEEIDDLAETEREEDEPASKDEIRLRAYYRYMERQGGDDDEIADWLAAESELRQPGEGGRAAERRDARP